MRTRKSRVVKFKITYNLTILLYAEFHRLQEFQKKFCRSQLYFYTYLGLDAVIRQPPSKIIISFEEFQNDNSAVGTIHDLILNGKYRPYMIVRSSIEMFNARTNMTQKISSSSKMCKGTVWCFLYAFSVLHLLLLLKFPIIKCYLIIFYNCRFSIAVQDFVMIKKSPYLLINFVMVLNNVLMDLTKKKKYVQALTIIWLTLYLESFFPIF